MNLGTPSGEDFLVELQRQRRRRPFLSAVNEAVGDEMSTNGKQAVSSGLTVKGLEERSGLECSMLTFFTAVRKGVISDGHMRTRPRHNSSGIRMISAGMFEVMILAMI